MTTPPFPLPLCAKCGVTRQVDKLQREKLRKHGKPDWCSQCYLRHAKNERHARVGPERKRSWNWATRYGLSAEQVEAMKKAQDGRCAICREPLTAKTHIDHCHATGKVRGILCHGCNMKLTIVENPPLLAAAQAYLAKSKL